MTKEEIAGKGTSVLRGARRLPLIVVVASVVVSATTHFESYSGPPSETEATNLARLEQLGRGLFFDKRLSLNSTLSCATCHDPASAFADHNTKAIGMRGKIGSRNVPTILNSVFSTAFFVDGRAAALEEQAKHPLISPLEMGMPTLDAVVGRVAMIPEYRLQFKQIFGKTQLTIEMIVTAIAAYERTLISNNSPFDRFVAGDENSISESQKRGWALFRTKAHCITCHEARSSFGVFTDNKFHNTGVASKDNDLAELAVRLQKKAQVNTTNEVDPNRLARAERFCELGRFNVTRNPKDIGSFKTPQLRDVELTAPYMHNGSLKTLIDVVRFYSRGGINNSHIDPEMKAASRRRVEI